MLRASVLALSIGLVFAASAAAADPLRIDVLSSRPELVTAGSVLVRVTGATGAPTVAASAGAAAAAMHDDGNGGWLGLVDGLQDGDSTLVARSGAASAEVRVNNHLVNGGLFAGPQTTPFRCENQAFGLAAPGDAGCSAPTVVSYVYRSTAGGWRLLDPSGARPADVDQTKTNAAQTVPLIVRIEKGVVNRAAYVIAALADPAAPPPTPWDHRGSGWNGKLVYAFGGGASPDGHTMGTAIGFLDPNAGTVGGENAGFYEAIIRAGYAIASASLNVGGVTLNDVVQAETLAKVKETFIKRYGVPAFTIGIGRDGGALPLYLIAQNYPGLLDAEFAIGGYADPIEFQTAVNDCTLINRYLAATKLAWRESSKRAIAGDVSHCAALPAGGPTPCGSATPCTLQDDLGIALGTDPGTGAARNPFDNAGVQYGLAAFRSGLISEDQFIELNTLIGGVGANGALQSARTVGDADAIRAAYASGRVLTGGDGLADTAIVNVRMYPGEDCDDLPCPPDPATVVPAQSDRTLAIRTRIEFATTSPGNYAEFIFADRAKDVGPDGVSARILAVALALLDKWLTDARADRSGATLAERIVTWRPPALRDTCVIDIGTAITEKKGCDGLYPAAEEPRVAAGAPPSDDVLKCQLKPVTAADYPDTISAGFLGRVGQVFPGGVCDYDKPGAGQVPPAGAWLAFSGNGKFAASTLP